MHDVSPKLNGRLSAPPLIDTDETPARLRRRWNELSDRFLPLRGENSIWRFSRPPSPDDAPQGWKIHLPATILSACRVLELAAPVLHRMGVMFKAPTTIDEVAKLNSGLWYGYTQVGKVVTVYPAGEELFLAVVRELDRVLPRRLAAPAVPFDHRFAEGSNIFYRYGAFATRTLTDGKTPAIAAPDGELVPDRRDTPGPDWADPPVPVENPGRAPIAESPLSTRYRTFRSISQRGKGGVYEAIDTGADPHRLCIIKEGRRHGETAWDGRDGKGRIENEARVLRELSRKGVPVPRPLDTFEAAGNAYTVIEKLTGENLHQYVARRRRRLPLRMAIAFGIQIARVVAAMHGAGWVWRDCKPSNFIILAGDGSLGAVDLEGACPADQFDPLPWATPNFAAPEIFRPRRHRPPESNKPEDLFSLGMCLYFLVEGELPSHRRESSESASRSGLRACEGHRSVEAPNCNFAESPRFRRRNVPRPVKALIAQLLSDVPGWRPSAADAVKILAATERDLLK